MNLASKLDRIAVHRHDRKVMDDNAHRRKLHGLTGPRERIRRTPANLLRAVCRRGLQQLTIEVLRVRPHLIRVERNLHRRSNWLALSVVGGCGLPEADAAGVCLVHPAEELRQSRIASEQ